MVLLRSQLGTALSLPHASNLPLAPHPAWPCAVSVRDAVGGRE